MRRISHELGRRLMRVSLVRTRFTVGRSVVMSLALGARSSWVSVARHRVDSRITPT